MIGRPQAAPKPRTTGNAVFSPVHSLALSTHLCGRSPSRTSQVFPCSTASEGSACATVEGIKVKDDGETPA